MDNVGLNRPKPAMGLVGFVQNELNQKQQEANGFYPHPLCDKAFEAQEQKNNLIISFFCVALY